MKRIVKNITAVLAAVSLLAAGLSPGASVYAESVSVSSQEEIAAEQEGELSGGGRGRCRAGRCDFRAGRICRR